MIAGVRRVEAGPAGEIAAALPRPPGKASLTPVLAALGVDPMEELARVKAKHGIVVAEPAEYQRINESAMSRPAIATN